MDRLVRGELDWIVMKALEKDRTRRYESATALGRDIECYLNDAPVEACPPSAGYRLGKFLRRHRAGVLTAAACLVLLAAGVAGSTWQAIRATAAEAQTHEAKVQADADRDRALTAERLASARLAEVLQQKERAEQAEKKTAEKAATLTAMNTFLLRDLLGQADPANQPFLGPHIERNPNITVAELLDRAAKTIDGRFAGEPATEALIRTTLGNAYGGLGKHGPAQAQLERALAVYTAKFGPHSPDAIVCKHNLALAYSLGGKNDQAVALYEEVLASKHGLAGADPVGMLAAKNNLALATLKLGQVQRAEALLKEVVAECTAQLGPKDSRTLSCRNNLVMVYHAQKRFGEAATEQQEVIDLLTATRGADHPHTLLSKSNLAVLYRNLGKYAEAEKLYVEVLGYQEKVLGADHPQTLGTKFNLAILYQARGRLDLAQPLFQEAADGSRRQLGLANADTQQRIYELITCLERTGKAETAEALYREVIAFLKGKDQGPEYLAWNDGLAAHLLARKKSAEAEPVLRECLALRGKHEPNAWKTFHLRALLGGVLSDQEKYVEAEPLLLAGYEGLKERAAMMSEQARGLVIQALQRLVQLYERWGKEKEAARWRAELQSGKQL
jgi:tetratricopeptide (TPR) repeat protein